MAVSGELHDSAPLTLEKRAADYAHVPTLAAAGCPSHSPVPAPPPELFQLAKVWVPVTFTERFRNCDRLPRTDGRTDGQTDTHSKCWLQAVTSQNWYKDKILCSKHECVQVRVMWWQQVNVRLSVCLSVCVFTIMFSALKSYKTAKPPFYPALLRYSKEHCFFEGSQASPVCLSAKSNIKMKMSADSGGVTLTGKSPSRYVLRKSDTFRSMRAHHNGDEGHWHRRGSNDTLWTQRLLQRTVTLNPTLQ
jgi:hypothetical protein